LETTRGPRGEPSRLYMSQGQIKQRVENGMGGVVKGPPTKRRHVGTKGKSGGWDPCGQPLKTMQRR